MNKIILASKSEVRKRILLENGISCNAEPSKVDEDVIKESLLSFKRAGADCILTYFASEIAETL